MEKNIVTLQLPAGVYDKLQELAAVEQSDPVEMLSRLITLAHQRQGWLRDLTSLRAEIRQAGGLRVGGTKDEVTERLRQTRREIFDAEYAHLY